MLEMSFSSNQIKILKWNGFTTCWVCANEQILKMKINRESANKQHDLNKFFDYIFLLIYSCWLRVELRDTVKSVIARYKVAINFYFFSQALKQWKENKKAFFQLTHKARCKKADCDREMFNKISPQIFLLLIWCFVLICMERTLASPPTISTFQ